MLHVVLWKWNQPNAREHYTSEHVNMMAAMLRRALGRMPYRVVCVTDDSYGVDTEVYPLWPDCDNLANATRRDLPSCYRRLKLFDQDTQRQMGIEKGERILSIDLDTLLTGDITGLVSRRDRFLGWALKGDHHPKVFNGSFQMFTAGDLEFIWKEFDPVVSPKEAARANFKGSDQAWLSYRLVNMHDCDGLVSPEVVSYPNEIRRLALLDARTRIIFFHGRRKPWHQAALDESPWIKRYWRT